ncbi:MAG: metallophosphoesterase family protein, partial [Dehalococcoidia bacterium]
MGFDPWRGLRPRLSWLRQQPWWRQRSAAPNATGVVWGVEEYARAGMVLALVVLVVALIAIFAGRSGGAKHAATPTALVRRVATTATTAPVSSAVGSSGVAAPSAGSVVIHGLLLPGPNPAAPSGANNTSGQAGLIDPQVEVAIDGGHCPTVNSSPLGPGDNFALALPDGCAPPGTRIYFRARGTNPTDRSTVALQPFCVTTGDHPQSYLFWAASAGEAPNVDVRLTPGCADVPSTLAFVSPSPHTAPPADGGPPEPTFLVKLEPGFPGGVLSDEQLQLLAAAPGFPGGVETQTPLASAATPPAPPSVAGGPPGVQPPPGTAPPAIAAVPPGAANQPAVGTPAVLPPQPPTV